MLLVWRLNRTIPIQVMLMTQTNLEEDMRDRDPWYITKVKWTCIETLAANKWVLRVWAVVKPMEMVEILVIRRNYHLGLKTPIWAEDKAEVKCKEPHMVMTIK